MSELDQPLTRMLIECAQLLGTDLPLQAILDDLMIRMADLLPVAGCGIMLVGDQERELVAASSETVLAIETLQIELDEGPCTEAYRTGELVVVPDVGADERFPRFSPRAAAAGLAAVFTFPLRLRERRLGALNLYSAVPGPLDDQVMQLARVLADLAGGYLLSARARMEAETAVARLRHLSLHDHLTGLPNRTLLVELLERAVARARRSHGFAAVLFIDLDEFKAVNDRYGHHVGDELLKAVADRLTGVLRSGDTLARLGGDEFVALCEAMNGVADAEIVAERVVAALASPFDLQDVRVTVTGSVGVAFAGPGADMPASVVKDADFAMYQAKSRGGGRHHFSEPGFRAAADRQADLDRDLRPALAGGEFTVVYQPIVEVAGGRMVGAEALLRWNHPVRGLLLPGVFIPGAERTGLIVPIGEWVLQQACSDLAEWDRGAVSPGAVAVNVSAQQVMHPSFPSTVARVLDETGVDPSALSLEITETLLLADADAALAVLKDIKNFGVNLSLDDFGTGYSSLSYLRQFPVDSVKIDRSFTVNVTTDRAARSIVRAVIDLSHDLDLTVVAEGVESRSQWEDMAALRADYAQGHHFSPALTKCELTEFIARGRPD